MTRPDTPPRQLELVYRPGLDGVGWTGSCPAFPEIEAAGRSIHQVDLLLAPAVTRALEARYGEALAINVTPGGEELIEGGAYLKVVPVGPASLSCTMQPHLRG